MSRLNTQNDIDQTPTNLKLNMINNNLNRIYMQNERLQQLIEHREQIDKLKDVVEVSNLNWKKLAVLA
jgi:thermostable 8-oxoguanine DNA glycosylase